MLARTGIGMTLYHDTLSGMLSRYASKESPDVLIGWTPISRHCCVCERTVARWAKRHGFPACRLPDGRIMTSKSLIDQWIMARARAYTHQQSDEPEQRGLHQELTPES